MKTTPKNRRKAPKKRPKEIWYASHTQFCAATGKTKDEVKRAIRDPRAAGMFRVSRVSSALVEWLDANPSPEGYFGSVSEKERRQVEKIRKENRKLDFDFAVAQKEYVKVAEVKLAWAQALEAIMDAMKTGMTREDYNVAIRRIKAKLKELDL